MIDYIKLKMFLTVFVLGVSTNSWAKDTKQLDGMQKLLNAFHEYGITHCDSFIIKQNLLKKNWYYILKHNTDFIDKNVKEVLLTVMYGAKNDTVKVNYAFMQTPDTCFVRTSSTVSFSGTCAKNIDLNNQYIYAENPEIDYTHYKNNGDGELLAKEITVGNFKACFEEYNVLYKGKRDDDKDNK